MSKAQSIEWTLRWDAIHRTVWSGTTQFLIPSRKHTYIPYWSLQVYTLFFLFLLKTIDCGYSLEPPHRGGSNEYPQSMFWAEIWELFEFFVWKFSIFRWLTFQYI